MSNSFKFAEMLTEKFNQEGHHSFEGIGVVEGRKFDKIVVMRSYNGKLAPARILAFVERSTGDLYKPASYKAPAKHKRYNGNELLNMAVEDADLFGSFLYMR